MTSSMEKGSMNGPTADPTRENGGRGRWKAKAYSFGQVLRLLN